MNKMENDSGVFGYAKSDARYDMFVVTVVTEWLQPQLINNEAASEAKHMRFQFDFTETRHSKRNVMTLPC